MESPVCKKSRLTNYSIRSDLNNDDVINGIKSSWTSSQDYSNNGVEITTQPFPVCIVKNFVNEPELLKQVAREVKNVTFNQKSNDLYEFKQSEDVRNLTHFDHISQLYDLIRLDGRKWVNNILGGNKLSEDVSSTFSSYEYQDRLLCHDDKCEDRHIAFILYLVEDWEESDGGFLELFNSDQNGYPYQTVKSICPQFNSMVFFEVTHYSFHQVSEVKSKTRNRLSINGWFHSSGKKLDKASCVILEKEQIAANDMVFNLEDYFLFLYFDNMNKVNIKRIFAAESEIQLDEFLGTKFLEEIVTDLKSDGVRWILTGPANMRKYEIADPSSLPTALRRLKELFQSKSWFKYLKDITSLDFAPSLNSDPSIWERGIMPTCTFEIQKWTHSCYTLIHDKDPEFHSEALDVILRIPYDVAEGNENDDTDSPEAGHIIYIDSASKDEECLLHIGYKMNSLGLIFRDEKTLRFTKYLDSTAKPFYQIMCTYRQWKPPVDQPGLKHCEEEESEGSFSEPESDDCS